MAPRMLLLSGLFAFYIVPSICLAGPPPVESIDLRSDALTVTFGEMRATADAVMLQARKSGMRRVMLRGHVRLVMGDIQAVAESGELMAPAGNAGKFPSIRLSHAVRLKSEKLRAAAEIATFDDEFKVLKLEGMPAKPARIQRPRDRTAGQIEAEQIWYFRDSDSIKLDGIPGSKEKE